MNEVSIEEIRMRLSKMEEKRKYYEWKSENTAERLKRHVMWRHSYLANPYLIGAPPDRLASRFKDVFINQMELNSNGQIGMLPVDIGENFMQKFTHLLEEYESRNMLQPPDEVIMAARKPLLRYFENGDPIAKQIFKGFSIPETPILVKYGRREFLEPMLREGRIRICPASYYNNDEHGDAIRDDELTRNFFIPTFRDRLNGKHYLDFQGHHIEYGNDDILLPLIMQDYYLLSLCDHIYYRMPTDFDADSALVIRNPVLFTQRTISSFLSLLPDWEPLHGPITYYDPYLDYKKIATPELSKNFSYSYQREFRIAMRAKRAPKIGLQPVFINIGQMTDYAELLSA